MGFETTSTAGGGDGGGSYGAKLRETALCSIPRDIVNCGIQTGDKLNQLYPEFQNFSMIYFWMKYKVLGLLTCFCIISTGTSVAQFKSLYDSKYKKFNIGYELDIPANQQIQIILYNQDSSFQTSLLDTTFKKNQKVIMIFRDLIDSEKENFIDYFIITIPKVNSGIYYMQMIIREKFLLTKWVFRAPSQPRRTVREHIVPACPLLLSIRSNQH